MNTFTVATIGHTAVSTLRFPCVVMRFVYGHAHCDHQWAYRIIFTFTFLCVAGWVSRVLNGNFAVFKCCCIFCCIYMLLCCYGTIHILTRCQYLLFHKIFASNQCMLRFYLFCRVFGRYGGIYLFILIYVLIHRISS